MMRSATTSNTVATTPNLDRPNHPTRHYVAEKLHAAAKLCLVNLGCTELGATRLKGTDSAYLLWLWMAQLTSEAS